MFDGYTPARSQGGEKNMQNTGILWIMLPQSKKKILLEGLT